MVIQNMSVSCSGGGVLEIDWLIALMASECNVTLTCMLLHFMTLLHVASLLGFGPHAAL